VKPVEGVILDHVVLPVVDQLGPGGEIGEELEVVSQDQLILNQKKCA